MQTFQLAHEIEDNFDAAEIVAPNRAQAFNSSQRFNRTTIEVVTVRRIVHRSEQPMLAINKNPSSRQVEEVRGRLNRVDRIRRRLEQLDAPRMSPINCSGVRPHQHRAVLCCQRNDHRVEIARSVVTHIIYKESRRAVYSAANAASEILADAPAEGA